MKIAKMRGKYLEDRRMDRALEREENDKEEQSFN